MAEDIKSDLNAEVNADDWSAAMAEQEPTILKDAIASGPAAQARVFPELSADGAVGGVGRLDMVMDIPVQLTAELGRTKIAIRNLLQLAQGSVIELDRLAGEPMDLLVNGCLIAQGEVVVINDKFGIRLTDVIAPDERLRRLRR